MQKCWSLDPDQRPTPIDVVASLTPLDLPAQDVKDELNGVKVNSRQHLSEYYNCPLVRQICCFIFPLSHTFFLFLSCIIYELAMYSSTYCGLTYGERGSRESTWWRVRGGLTGSNAHH